MSKITIKEIAKLAGVSTTTVSRYINNKDSNKMGEITKNKIKDIIEKYNYIPSEIARNLANKKNNVIGVCIADIKNPFSSKMLEAISDVCINKKYKIMISISSNNYKLEREIIDNFIKNNVEGIILNTTGENETYFQELKFKNIIVIDRPFNDLMFDTVTADNYNSTKEILEYIYESKYECIYFVSEGINNITTRKIRLKAFKDIMKFKYKLNDKEIMKYHLDLSKFTNKDMLDFKENIKTKKTAVFTVNGETLIQFLKIIKRENIKLKKDIGVASYEYWDWMDFIEPSLTVVDQNSYEIGKMATQLLIEKIENSSIKNSNIKYIEIKSNIKKGGSI